MATQEAEIAALEQEILDKKVELVKLIKAMPRKAVPNYDFLNAEGQLVAFAELFGDSNDLIVIQNMGRSCSYCTLWADSLNGIANILLSRCPVAICSPDEPAVMKAFADDRAWRLPMISSAQNTFKVDLGFTTPEGDHWPGCSTFRKSESGEIHLVASRMFGPGDDFCAVWHLFDLLEEGDAGWTPRYIKP